jgi:hypothetical protein
MRFSGLRLFSNQPVYIYISKWGRTVMKRRLYIIMIICFGATLITPAAAGKKGGARVFTNQDLQHYGDPADKDKKVPERTTHESLPHKTDEPLNIETVPITKRYIIPYNGTARRIIIPVTFNRSVTVPMLLDTGAPGMFVSKKLAEKLGLLDNDEANLETLAGGIGGTVPAIFTIIDSIQVGEAEDKFIPTTISELKIPGFEGLVGMDFMGKYSMQLDNRKRVVIFEELPESPSRPAGHDELWWRTTFRKFKSTRDGWRKYRDAYREVSANTSSLKRVKSLVNKQHDRADYLYNRLKVYASENSVPLEWR